MHNPTWVTVPEAVILTGKGERTIRRIVAEHHIDARQNGRSILWHLPQIRAAIAQRRPGRKRNPTTHEATESDDTVREVTNNVAHVAD